MTTLAQKEARRVELANKIVILRDRIAANKDKPLSEVITGEERQELERMVAEEKGLNAEVRDGRLLADLEERDRTIAEFNAEQQRRGIVPRNGDTSDGPFSRRGGDGGSTELRAEQRALALQAYFRSGAGRPLTKAHREACKAVKFNPDQKRFKVRLLTSGQHKQLRGLVRVGREAEFRNMTVGTPAAGGYFVQPEFVAGFERILLENAPMLRIAKLIRTNGGGQMTFNNVDDTGNTGEQLGEAASIGSSVDPTISQMALDAYKYSSKVVKVSNELIEDDAYSFIEELQTLLGERIARILNTRFTTGTGSSQPRGVVTAAAAGITAAGVAAITAAEVIKLKRKVKAVYRKNGIFMAHSETITALLVLQDSTGRFLWKPGLAEAAPATIDNSPYEENDDMATMAASAVSLVYGDPSQYYARQVKEVRFRRLDERFADTDEVGFVALGRYDGDLRHAADGSFKKLTHPAS